MIELPVHSPKNAPVRCLMLYLTEDCNLRCTYCFVKKSPREMSLATAEKAVDFFLHRDISGTRPGLFLTFFGGEPFMNLDAMEGAIQHAGRVARLQGRRVHFSSTTNATLLTKRVEQIIRDAEMSLVISFDGGEDAMAQRPYVGGGSPYRTVARNIRRLTEWSPAVYVRMTYHPEALNLKENVSRALDLGAPSVALYPVSESDWRGYETRLAEAYDELADWFIAEALGGRYLPLDLTWQQLREYHWHGPRGTRPERPCQVGTGLISVDPDGNVMPCHRFLYRPTDWLGTVDTPAFSPDRQKYVRLSSRDLLGCEDCVAQPMCGGGCRVLVLLEDRDLQSGTHPGYCLNTRSQANAVRRIYNTLLQEQPESFLAAMHTTQSRADRFGELLP